MHKPTPMIGAPPLGADETRRLLADVLARASAGASRSLVVFDLDSTLLDNRPRQAQIMREYGERAGVAALAAAAAEHWEGWDFRKAMRNAGLAPDDVELHHEPFRHHWRRHFFTSEYCRLDLPIPGAPVYARAIAETGCHVCYVTGRHEPMREGTLESFRKGGFPLPDGESVRLLMKPTLDETDDAFKERTFAVLQGLGSLIAAFDNEPTHINGYREAFPDALSIHLATDHSLREVKVLRGIPSIRDFSAFGGG